jgi:hypothetical protein
VAAAAAVTVVGTREIKSRRSRATPMRATMKQRGEEENEENEENERRRIRRIRRRRHRNE